MPDERKIKEREQGGKKREEKRDLLFCLDGVRWSHIIAGDVTALSGGQGASQPPVPFSVRMKREHTASLMLLTHPKDK